LNQVELIAISGRLIGTASSTWWWPGMKVMTNDPYLLP